MSTPQAPSTKTAKFTKSYLKKISLAVAAAVTITVFITAGIFGASHATINDSNAGMYSPGAHSIDVLSGPIVLNPKGCYLTGFEVPGNAKNATLQGNYTVVDGAANKAASLTVWSQQEFLNYFGNNNADPCYNKGLMPMPQDNINIPLSKGYYLILISGAGSETAVLEAQLTLNFTI